MKLYNKLIRDNIPEIIEMDNKSCVISVLPDDQFKKELMKKLVEEANELSFALNKEELINELADIQEILDNVRRITEISQEEVIAYQNTKAKKNGTFDKKLFLISVDDHHE
jgi:predicted house-cleaning noncanonical NTP pyrophosphatase (MazG superfamily)